MFFGERFGVISPRASYMRSVCGCISASSAATEIMKTPRSASKLVATLVVRRCAISPRSTFAPVADASRSSRSRGLRSFIVSANSPSALLLLVGEVARHLDLEPVADVAAAAAARLRRALAAQPLDGPVLGPGRDPDPLACRSGSAPRRSRPAIASAIVIGTVDLEVAVVALGEDRRGATRGR